ncbi:unnamed protein product, partial [Tetraodon nigroviridis]
ELEQTGEGEEPKVEETTEQRLLNIAKELLQTERAYVARLHLLDQVSAGAGAWTSSACRPATADPRLSFQVFCARLTEEAGRGSFPPEVIKTIFSNVSSIYSFHSQFLLPDLETCLRCWSERPGLGHVLLQHGPFLRMYADYVRNFDQAVELVRVWNERSAAFRSITQDIQSQEVCGSLSLQHHMLEPVQRIPRYELLLKDYLKQLPQDSPDYELAHKSLQTVSMAATHSNSAIHKADSLKRVLEIYEMVGDEEVVNPANEFIREGRLLKLAARNTSSMERHLFLVRTASALPENHAHPHRPPVHACATFNQQAAFVQFNNFLLCCTPKFSLVGQRFTVRCRIGVDGMQVQRTTNEDHPHSFQVSGKERTLELQASSEQDRDEWIKEIQEAIDTFQEKNETFRLASRERGAGPPRPPLDPRPRSERVHEMHGAVQRVHQEEAPLQGLRLRELPDEARAPRAEPRLTAPLSPQVVCWRCSDYKVALEYDGNRLNKVCKSCYSILSAQREERTDGRRQTLEFAVSLQSSRCLIRSFLFYGDDPKTWQQLWCVFARTEPATLQLFAAQQVGQETGTTSPAIKALTFFPRRQDAAPLSCIPLSGCEVDESCPELQGLPCFRLKQPSGAHTFCCEGAELQRSWLAVLKDALTGKTR